LPFSYKQGLEGIEKYFKIEHFAAENCGLSVGALLQSWRPHLGILIWLTFFPFLAVP
jgi:hypothetical protein